MFLALWQCLKKLFFYKFWNILRKKIVSFSSNNTFWIFSFKAMGTIDAVFIESTNSVFLVMVLIVLILIFFISSSSFSSKRNVKEPPWPRAFPLLGNLLQLDLKRLDISLMEVFFFSGNFSGIFSPPVVDLSLQAAFSPLIFRCLWKYQHTPLFLVI